MCAWLRAGAANIDGGCRPGIPTATARGVQALTSTCSGRECVFHAKWPPIPGESGQVEDSKLSTSYRSEATRIFKVNLNYLLKLCLFQPEKMGSLLPIASIYMKRLCKRAKVTHLGFNAIRHLSASILAQSNIPLPTIQAILRHKSANTTARYLHSLGIVEDVFEWRVWQNKSPGRAVQGFSEMISTRFYTC